MTLAAESDAWAEIEAVELRAEVTFCRGCGEAYEQCRAKDCSGIREHCANCGVVPMVVSVHGRRRRG